MTPREFPILRTLTGTVMALLPGEAHRVPVITYVIPAHKVVAAGFCTRSLRNCLGQASVVHRSQSGRSLLATEGPIPAVHEIKAEYADSEAFALVGRAAPYCSAARASPPLPHWRISALSHCRIRGRHG